MTWPECDSCRRDGDKKGHDFDKSHSRGVEAKEQPLEMLQPCIGHLGSLRSTHPAVFPGMAKKRAAAAQGGHAATGTERVLSITFNSRGVNGR
jgi:hypothetical protein